MFYHEKSGWRVSNTSGGDDDIVLGWGVRWGCTWFIHYVWGIVVACRGDNEDWRDGLEVLTLSWVCDSGQERGVCGDNVVTGLRL